MVLSLGLFEANAIQLGMDQLLESSSDQLSSFIHWYYWSGFAGQSIPLILTAGITVIESHCIVAITSQYPTIDILQNYDTFCISLIQLTLTIAGLIVLIRYKKRLNIEKSGNNPLKLIYKVLKYAWKHKFPENRSAFTYWEMTFLLALTLVRTSMEDRSLLRRWRTPSHSFVFSSFSTLYWDSIYQDMATRLHNI